MKDTKKFILQQSLQLFLIHGYRGVSMNMIVEETGLSKGAFYHHFKSKEEVFLNVFEEYYLKRVLDFYNGMPSDSFEHFLEESLNRAKRITEKLLKTFSPNSQQHQEQGHAFYSILLDIIRHFPNYRDSLHKLLMEERSYWHTIIKKAQANGEINDSLPSEEIANLFLFSADGFRIQLFLGYKSESPYAEMAKGFRMIYKLIKA